MTKQKLILAALLAAVLVVAGIFYWKSTHVARPKYIMLKKRAAAIQQVPAVIKKKHVPALPEVKKKFANPKVAIVLDDFGYNMNNIDALLKIKEPVTLSILPNLPYSRKVAETAEAHGYEVILHLPLESHRKDVKEEPDTIRTGMSEKEVLARLDEEISNIPGLKGVSNHMGSKATEDRALMTIVLKELKRKGLYFSDSLTSEKSVSAEVAAAIGAPCVKRDMFLDNSNDSAYIEKQLMDMRALAFRRGRLIAVGHDRKNTIAALNKWMGEMSKDGIRFVSLSKMVK